MRSCFAGLLLFLTMAGQANATEILMKSGARGEISASIIAAPERLGGPSNGNLVELSVLLKPSSRTPIPEVDAPSICRLHGQSTYENMGANTELRTLTEGFIDFDAPLSGIRVSFRWDKENAIMISSYRDFDMRGLVKCRPAL